MCEDWYVRGPCQYTLHASPQLTLERAASLSEACRVFLQAARAASGFRPEVRLTDIAWRLDPNTLHVVGDHVTYTNGLLPYAIERPQGEAVPRWSQGWFCRYEAEAPFGPLFNTCRIRWGVLHDDPNCNIPPPKHFARNDDFPVLDQP